jgi:hypothetical protein
MGWRCFSLVVVVLPLISGIVSAQLSGLPPDGERLKMQPPATGVRRDVPQAPFVVCGTLIVPTDSRIDPKIRIEPPKTNAEYTIRTLEPPICWPDSPR